MNGISAIAGLAALMGDQTRANILFALREDGRISAGELAHIAGVAPSTISEHLAKLVEAGLIAVVPMGRQRFYRLAHGSVAELLEGLEATAHRLDRQVPPQRLDRARVHARACLDHIAGELGGQLAGALAEKGFVHHTAKGVFLTEAGDAWIETLGADPAAMRSAPRRLVGMCRDWTSDLPHVGGAVGGAMLRRFREADWVRLDRASGHIDVTPKGAAGLRQALGIDVRPLV